MSKCKIQWYNECPVCGLGMSGTSEETSECSNTMCVGRASKHGIKNNFPIIEGRVCSVCNKPLYEGINAAFCANDECERYLREQ